MRLQQRVTHILIGRLDNGYMKTLCARIVYYPGAVFGLYPDSRYFDHYHPDCQDCLQVYYTIPKVTHE